MRGYPIEKHPQLIQMLPPAIAAIALGGIAILLEIKKPQGTFFDAFAIVLMWLIVTAASISAVLTFRWVVYNLLLLQGIARSNHFKPMIEFAKAIENLNQRQIDMIATHDAMTVKMLLSMEGELLKVRWIAKTPIGDVPLGFIGSFLKSSRRFYPNLIPISHHDRDRELREWKNSEWLCKATTEMFVALGIAEKIGSNQSARLKDGYDIHMIASTLNLEVD